MRVIILSIVFILIPLVLPAQNNEFDWLVGKWKIENTQSEIFEEWIKEGDRLKGESYIFVNGEKKTSEIIFLQKFDYQWAYIALPKGQTITLFPLIQTKNDEYIFENKEHDFPQRIIYKYNCEDTLSVIVEGIENGENKKLAFKMSK